MIVVESYRGRPVTDLCVEVVERKGTGHPDTLCDSMMEAISVALCREYLREFGAVLHHNIDKGLLAAGQVEKGFGGGRVLRPMELTIGDRATFSAAGKTIPVAEIAVETAREWLKRHLRHVDPLRHLDTRVMLAPGSAELTDIFARPGVLRAANDTSAAIGYWPPSPTERAVLELEHHLNSPDFKERFPETGEDVKVMGLRHGDTLELTVAMPLLAAHIDSEAGYFARKEAVGVAMGEFVRRFAAFSEVTIRHNALDLPGRGQGGVYLSLLGTSAEDADSGQVGRGNRVNGIIALNRPLGAEAVAGKNPVSHVGKIYNVLAYRLAREIQQNVAGIREAYVLLLSRIGDPVDRPWMASAQLLLESGVDVEDVRAPIEARIEHALAGMAEFCMELSTGKYPVC
ncbi:MAG: methionine adenosyltransferase [Gammaproteobacteria bacterium]|nr:methionine adenosyltransferase [Gammaproteobacteria bacterium]